MRNKLNFELSRLALNDLDSIWIYSAETWSKTQANKYYKEIIKTINSLCINPNLGKSIQEIKPKHRMTFVNSHMIIYKIEQERIWIDRIVHQRMDIDNEL